MENMENIEQLEEQIKELQARVEQMKRKNEKLPRVAEVYYILDTKGNVNKSTWNNDMFDIAYADIGNVFRNSEDARREADARKVFTKLKMQPGGRGFIVGKRNFYIKMFYRDEYCDGVAKYFIEIEHAYLTPSNSCVFFETREYAERAIDAVGEKDLLNAFKWYAGIKE